ncbi:MAG: rhamnogalacturonan lyase family protein [Thermoguttaceae bacterium]
MGHPAAVTSSNFQRLGNDTVGQRLYSAQGQLISDQRDGTMSLPIYWDADLQRELIRRNEIVDYRGQEHATPIEGHVVAIADVLGDWREEIF